MQGTFQPGETELLVPSMWLVLPPRKWPFSCRAGYRKLPLPLQQRVKLLKQCLQCSAKEPFVAGKVSVSQFAGNALTVSRGKKQKKPSSVERAANKKQRQMCPGGDLIWSHCADGIWFCDASGHVSFLFSISKSAHREKWLWWTFVTLVLDKSNSIVGCQWVAFSPFFNLVS